jgi:hypothetical protein
MIKVLSNGVTLGLPTPTQDSPRGRIFPESNRFFVSGPLQTLRLFDLSAQSKSWLQVLALVRLYILPPSKDISIAFSLASHCCRPPVVFSPLARFHLSSQQ